MQLVLTSMPVDGLIGYVRWLCLMQVLEREAAERAAAEKQFPDFKSGDILELKLVSGSLGCCVAHGCQVVHYSVSVKFA
jgi:uncharacterized protein YijF (DUF1287 family)